MKDDVDGKHILVHVDAAADLFDLEREYLPRLSNIVGPSLFVDLLDEVRPGVADVGDVAVVCGVVDE